MTYIPDVHEYGTIPDKEESLAQEFISKDRKNNLRNEILEIFNQEADRMEEYASEAISEIAAARATRFLEKLIAGDEDCARQLLEAEEGSRRRTSGCDEGEPWPSVIHGSIFQTEPMRLREKIVNEFSDLLKTERIADLESTVEGLRKQLAEMQEREKQRTCY